MPVAGNNKTAYTPIQVSFDLKDVISILENAGNKKLYDSKKVKPSFLDTFLYSGRFNSVLGLDGFQLFKDQLREVIKKVNADDFGANYINLDQMFETLLASGVYYVEDHLPEELKDLKGDSRWLTAYRYIAKNFTEISYKDFREIVKRFQDSSGHSFYILSEDSEGLLGVAKHADLFTEVVNAKAALIHLSQKELKSICEQVSVKPARSIEETVDRIVESVGEKALDFLPPELRARRTLIIKDSELATGDDVIHLDGYLRSIAKVVREDLVSFINRQRHGVIAA
jgi:hypothetical protein